MILTFMKKDPAQRNLRLWYPGQEVSMVPTIQGGTGGGQEVHMASLPHETAAFYC